MERTEEEEGGYIDDEELDDIDDEELESEYEELDDSDDSAEEDDNGEDMISTSNGGATASSASKRNRRYRPKEEKKRDYYRIIQSFTNLHEKCEMHCKALELDEKEKIEETNTTGTITTRCALLCALDNCENKNESNEPRHDLKTNEGKETEDKKIAAAESPPPSLPATDCTTPSLFSKQHPKVKIHSLATSRGSLINGRIGVLQRYIPKTDRFQLNLLPSQGKENEHMEIDNKEPEEEKEKEITCIAVKHCNITCLDTHPYSSFSRQNEPDWFQALFRPGTKYSGSIQIPQLNNTASSSSGNDGDENRENYELVILSHEPQQQDDDNEWTPPVLLARHCAYKDEQYVRVAIKITQHKTKNSTTEKTIEIEYADSETRCLGSWSMPDNQFHGRVWQLMADSDHSSGFGGVYYPREDATHTFNLSPCSFLFSKGIATCEQKRKDGEEEMKDEGMQEQKITSGNIMEEEKFACKGSGNDKGKTKDEDEKGEDFSVPKSSMTTTDTSAENGTSSSNGRKSILLRKDSSRSSSSSSDNCSDNHEFLQQTSKEELLPSQSQSLTIQRSTLHSLCNQVTDILKRDDFKEALKYIMQYQDGGEEARHPSLSSLTLWNGGIRIRSRVAGIRRFRQRLSRSLSSSSSSSSPNRRTGNNDANNDETSNNDDDNNNNEEEENLPLLLISNLAQMNWDHLLNEAVRCVEHTCCNFRHYAALLDKQTFETLEEKDQFLSPKKNEKDTDDANSNEHGPKKKIVISKKEAHQIWETNSSTMHVLFSAWTYFSNQPTITANPTAPDSSAIGEKFMMSFYNTHHRLTKNYSILEGAWDRLERRPTEEDIACWTTRSVEKTEKWKRKNQSEGEKDRGRAKQRGKGPNRWIRHCRRGGNGDGNDERNMDEKVASEEEDESNTNDDNNEEKVCAICYEPFSTINAPQSRIKTNGESSKEKEKDANDGNDSSLFTKNDDNMNVNNGNENDNNAYGNSSNKNDKEKNHHPLYLPCGHCFHSSCIRDWFHNHSQCPICRFQLELLSGDKSKT